MTIVIDLTPEEEVRLRRKAGQQGQDEETAVKTVVRQWLEEPGPEATDVEIPDYWKGYVGVVDSGGRFNYSENPSKAFAEILAAKHREGKL